MRIKIISVDNTTNNKYSHIVEWLGDKNIESARKWYSRHNYDAHGNEIVDIVQI